MSSSRRPGPPRHGRRGGGQPPGAARDRSGQHAPRAGGRPPRRGSRQVRPDQRRPACCGRSGRVGRRRTALRRATAIGPSGLFTERRARFLVDVAAPTTSGGRAARSCNSCKRHTTSLLSRSRATPTFERWSATSFKTRVDGSPPTFVGGRSGLASCLRSLRLSVVATADAHAACWRFLFMSERMLMTLAMTAKPTADRRDWRAR